GGGGDGSHEEVREGWGWRWYGWAGCLDVFGCKSVAVKVCAGREVQAHARGDGPSGLMVRMRAMNQAHARGDGPHVAINRLVGWCQAPRTWGWTDRVTPVMAERSPSPTDVGLDRTAGGTSGRAVTKPHARGDGPFRIAMAPRGAPQAPRTWGWTEPGNSRKRKTTPSPTHVGMDRTGGRTGSTRPTKPHARGDGPTDAV